MAMKSMRFAEVIEGQDGIPITSAWKEIRPSNNSNAILNILCHLSLIRC